MLIRNAIILGILAPRALLASLLSILFMLVACVIFGLKRTGPWTERASSDVPVMKLESPFSLISALKFGLLFLLIQIVGLIAQKGIGEFGIYGVSLVGGMFSSSSSVAAAAAIFSNGTITANVAGICATVASAASVFIDLPFVVRAGQTQLTKRLTTVTITVIAAGIIGAFLQQTVLPSSLR